MGKGAVIAFPYGLSAEGFKLGREGWRVIPGRREKSVSFWCRMAKKTTGFQGISGQVLLGVSAPGDVLSYCLSKKRELARTPWKVPDSYS